MKGLITILMCICMFCSAAVIDLTTLKGKSKKELQEYLNTLTDTEWVELFSKANAENSSGFMTLLTEAASNVMNAMPKEAALRLSERLKSELPWLETTKENQPGYALQVKSVNGSTLTGDRNRNSQAMQRLIEAQRDIDIRDLYDQKPVSAPASNVH